MNGNSRTIKIADSTVVWMDLSLISILSWNQLAADKNSRHAFHGYYIPGNLSSPWPSMAITVSAIYGK